VLKLKLFVVCYNEKDNYCVHFFNLIFVWHHACCLSGSLLPFFKIDSQVVFLLQQTSKLLLALYSQVPVVLIAEKIYDGE
jgi:hypothetical protein